MNLCHAALVRLQSGEGHLAHQSAGDIEIIAILVGAGTGDGIVEAHGIAFARDDLVAELRPAGQVIGRAGPGRLAAQRLVEFQKLARAIHHLAIGVAVVEMGVGEADDAVVAPGGHCEGGAVIEAILREINVGLTVVEAGIEMGEGDRLQALRPHDAAGLQHQFHGELHGGAALARQQILVVPVYLHIFLFCPISAAKQ